MGGEIDVESESGEGSTFCFTLSFEKRPEGARVVTMPRTDLRGLKVLVVDDNETNRKILCEQLTSWNMKNDQTEGGQRALEMLRSALEEGEPYHVAILDMQMPQMDGLQLARKIKEDSPISSTRLVLLTSLGQHGDSEEAREADIEAYLTKPVKQSTLYNSLVGLIAEPVVEEEEVTRRPAQKAPLVVRRGPEEAEARSRERLSRGRLLVAEEG
jgi:CheY-like chemotaxis protein